MADGDVYAMAGVDDDEYAIANGALDGETDDYELAVRALSGDIYARAGGFHDPTYDVSSSTDDAECDYDLSTMVGIGQDSTYDTAGGEQVYDTAGGIQLRGGDDNEDIYALAASNTDEDVYVLLLSLSLSLSVCVCVCVCVSVLLKVNGSVDTSSLPPMIIRTSASTLVLLSF